MVQNPTPNRQWSIVVTPPQFLALRHRKWPPPYDNQCFTDSNENIDYNKSNLNQAPLFPRMFGYNSYSVYSWYLLHLFTILIGNIRNNIIIICDNYREYLWCFANIHGRLQIFVMLSQIFTIIFLCFFLSNWLNIDFSLIGFRLI